MKLLLLDDGDALKAKPNVVAVRKKSCIVIISRRSVQDLYILGVFVPNFIFRMNRLMITIATFFQLVWHFIFYHSCNVAFMMTAVQVQLIECKEER